MNNAPPQMLCDLVILWCHMLWVGRLEPLRPLVTSRPSWRPCSRTAANTPQQARARTLNPPAPPMFSPTRHCP